MCIRNQQTDPKIKFRIVILPFFYFPMTPQLWGETGQRKLIYLGTCVYSCLCYRVYSLLSFFLFKNNWFRIIHYVECIWFTEHTCASIESSWCLIGISSYSAALEIISSNPLIFVLAFKDMLNVSARTDSHYWNYLNSKINLYQFEIYISSICISSCFFRYSSFYLLAENMHRALTFCVNYTLLFIA